MTITNLFVALLREDGGQDLIEYALLSSFVAIVVILGATALGTAHNHWYGAAAGGVDTSAGSAS
jgi:Flp pilus assembly pilin Flp